MMQLPAGTVTAGATDELEAVVVTATRRPEPAFRVPVATGVIDREAIRAAAPQTVMEALRGRPGTYFQQTTPGQSIVILRGLKGSEVLHLVDGFRLNDAIFRNAPNQYVALVDAQMLERLEVVRGPMSTLHGSDAMGGVVQMLSAEPRFEATEWSGAGALRAGFGSADDTVQLRLEGAAGRDGLALSGGVTYQDVGERRVGGGDTLPHTAYVARAANARLRADVTDGHELSLSVQHSEQPRTPRYDELTPGFGQTHPAAAVFYYEPQRREFAQLRWRGTQPTRLWDNAEAQVGRQRLVDDRRSRDFGSVFEERERNRDTTWGGTFQASKALGDRHLLTWGVDYYDDRVDASREREYVSTGQTSPRPPRFPDGSTMTQLGLFAVDDWSPDPRLDVLAGLRWSRSATELPASAGLGGVSVSDADPSGSLGASFEVRDGLRLIANLGHGFRAPNVFDLGSFGDRPGNRFNVPNPDLGPEQVTTLDAGLKVRRGRLQGELVAYRSRYTDKITSVLTGEVTASGRLVVQSRNAARLVLEGWEGELRGRPRDDVELYATTTWTRGDETSDGVTAPADRIPPLFGTAGVTWDALADLVLEAWIVYAGPQDRYSPRDELDPRIEPGGTAGWLTWNARAAWHAHRALDLSLRLTNLADRRYREFGSGLDAPGFGLAVALDWSF